MKNKHHEHSGKYIFPAGTLVVTMDQSNTLVTSEVNTDHWFIKSLGTVAVMGRSCYCWYNRRHRYFAYTPVKGTWADTLPTLPAVPVCWK